MFNPFNAAGYGQFEFARWYEKSREQYKIIKVSIVSENEKRWDTVIQNLITTSDSTVLRTAFAYPYAPRQHVFYRNKWWEILSVGEKSLDVAPQALAFANPVFTMQYVLELIEVNGYEV